MQSYRSLACASAFVAVVLLCASELSTASMINPECKTSVTSTKEFLDCVSPILGVGGDGYGTSSNPVGPQVPFGANRPGPDTSLDGFRLAWRQPGGYNYNDNTIRAFSHTHLVGAGTLDYGNIGIMPINKVRPLKCYNPAEGLQKSFRYCDFEAKFSHDLEYAHLCNYTVELLRDDEPSIEASLTTFDSHVAVHKYKFSANSEPTIVVDLLEAVAINEFPVGSGSYVELVGNNAIRGAVHNIGSYSSRIGGIWVYFYGELSEPFDPKQSGCWHPAGGLQYGQRNCSYSETQTSAKGGNDRLGQLIDLFEGLKTSTPDHLRAAKEKSIMKELWELLKLGRERNSHPLMSNTSINGAFLSGFGGTDVELYMAISFISPEQAVVNFQDFNYTARHNPPPFTPFDASYGSCRNAWEGSMSMFESVEGLDTGITTRLATHTYHHMLSPTQWDEAGGVYMGFDGNVHSVNEASTTKVGSGNSVHHLRANRQSDGSRQRASTERHVYTDLSIWDIFRTQYPLLLTTRPDVATDVLHSMLLMANQSTPHYLPKWELANGDTGGMEGVHAVVMFADAYHRNIGKSMVDYETFVKVADFTLQGHEGSDWTSLGYFPNAVCKTLEYALDDYALATVAKDLGFSSLADQYNGTSNNFRNVWDSEIRFFCPKDGNGKWIEECTNAEMWKALQLWPFDNNYVEGDAWHWRWFVPHNFPALIELFGGKQDFREQLQVFFANSTKEMNNFLPNQFYWAGNEEDLQAAYMFNFADDPYSTQYWARWVLENKYTLDPNTALSGNDDYGTMSAWFVWSAMGLYPLHATGDYALGSPLVSSMLLNVTTGEYYGNGDAEFSLIQFTAVNQSDSNVYVCGVKWNGNVYQPAMTSPYVIRHADLFASGGTWEFYMSDKRAPCL